MNWNKQYYVDYSNSLSKRLRMYGKCNLEQIYKKSKIMTFTAKKANLFATEYLNSENGQLDSILKRIEKYAKEGLMVKEFYDLSDYTINKLKELGYGVEKQGLNCSFIIYWNNIPINQKSVEVEFGSTDWKIYPDDEINKQCKENARIQNEAWVKQEKQKAKYEAFQAALAIHDKVSYNNINLKPNEQLLATYELIYQKLIADL